MHFQVV